MAERHPFSQWLNLEQPRFGTRVVYATDDFFAAKERLIDPAEPVFLPDKYDDHGKWMDGWESRRRREPGHDFCIVRLGCRGILHGLDIDTRYFTGNYPPEASLEGCVCGDDLPGEDIQWQPVLERTPLTGDSHHWLPLTAMGPFSHLRFHIYPDGGVARLRLYGEVCAGRPPASSKRADLLAMELGGRALICSDEHYGSMHNLTVAGRGINMGDGWETARRRGPGNDWVILALGVTGNIEEIEIDTAHFKGNYPDRASIEALYDENGLSPEQLAASGNWRPLLPPQRLSADHQHRFDALEDCGVISHVRLQIFPDGGVSRLRLYGRPADGP